MRLLMVLLLAAGCTSVPAPTQRSGALEDGSARWAHGIAAPAIQAFAADAQLHSVIGARVGRDGRLPADAGQWTFVAWSPAARQAIDVVVRYDGRVSQGTRAAGTAPSPNGPLDPAWVDSPIAFAAAAPYLACNASRVDLAVLNAATYAEAPAQQLWALRYDAGQNQLVRWNGEYVASQGTPNAPCASNLKSEFLRADACASMVIGGAGYDLDDPAWIDSRSFQNRDACAYKFFSAFHMLGYNTENVAAGATKPQLAVLRQFQAARKLPPTTRMTADALRELDTLLVAREAKIAPVAAAFPLSARMQPLHRHDVSKSWLAYLYALPMSVLPPALHMDAAETAQCIWGQCLGFLQDAGGAALPCQARCAVPIADLGGDFRFVGAYFDPRRPNSKLPSGAVHAGTVLHEYAHYLDRSLGAPLPGLSHQGSLDTTGFYDISYDIARRQGACAPARSQDPQDWITRYARVGSAPCPAGLAYILEDWAESFSMYVAAGRAFRAAAQRNATLARKYDWLKANVFAGREYDTGLQRGFESGCNDLPGMPLQPGYASCSGSYVWDAELRILP